MPAVTLESRLLPRAFERVADDGKKLVVLDLGPGRTETLDYLSGLERPCQVVFADCQELLTELAAFPEEEPATFNHLLQLWQQHLHLAPSVQIDIVLFWDYLHRFDLLTVEALSSALQPHIQASTRGHGFGCLHSDQPIFESRYAITKDLQIVMQRYADLSLPYAHAQQVLNEFFVCLRITKGTLLQKGYLELLFEADAPERRAPII